MSRLFGKLRRHLSVVVLSALLVACGGGGGGSDPSTLPPLGPGESAYDDPQAYSTLGSASLAGAVEAAAVTQHSLTLGGSAIAYTARAGHLIARDPASGAAEASVFYVAYTADNADAATRPVTFFYNGGPGSASVWLHLGSFGPQRLVTGVPATTAKAPFPLVDNAESLLDTSDLVFIDAVGTGLSQAIAPYTNASFWGVDADAALFRDFVVRWLAAQQRGVSPKYLYGESYGGPRSAVLARLLQASGVMLAGVVLQSPVLDYNSNCGASGSGSCQANLPTYAAAGAWYGLSTPLPTDIDAWMLTLRSYAATTYAPAVAAFLQGTPPPSALPLQLANYTGIGAALWTQQFNLRPDSFQVDLLSGALTGRYDARMSAAVGSALAADGDPSSTFIAPSFAAAIGPYLAKTLRYVNASTYVLTSKAIEQWNFGHGGQALPDTVPDLAAALAQNPALRVLAIGGYHDLATPFRVTELDLARLGALPNVQQRNYPGGHMSYLTDATRVRQKADLVAFYAGGASTRAAGAMRAPAAVAPPPLPDRAGTPPATPQRALAEPALQMPLRGPWVPHAASRPPAQR
jgi:carboxypeptidase C (cathepsin A)